MFVWGFLQLIMRFTDKATLTLTKNTFLFVFSHVTSSTAASIVQLVYVIPLLATHDSQTREDSAKIAMDILVKHYAGLSVCMSVARKHK